ncbi:MAG: hypothetical protein JNJ45_11585 [Chthonomonas sp.]|nr:hypothetical protein [Chthonomonas sp.]
MTKLSLSTLALAAVAVASAQPVYDNYDFSTGGLWTSSGSTPRSSFADDMTMVLAPGLASVNIDKYSFISRNTDTVSAASANQRLRFYGTYDDTITTGVDVFGGSVTSTITTGALAHNANTALFWTVTLGTGTPINISPAATKGFSIEYFTDNTFTAYTTQITPSFFYGTGAPSPHSAQSYFRDGSSAALDGIYFGTEKRNFGAPANYSGIGLRIFPRGTKLTGFVTFGDLSIGPETQDVWVEITDPNNSDLQVHRGWVECGTGGAYEAVIPDTLAAGTYRVRIKGVTWLSESVLVDTTLGDATSDFSLRNGDVNNDNLVDIADYSALAAAFDAVLDTDPVTAGNQSSPNWLLGADLNKDGIVDIGDYTPLASNFDGTGN